jgi:hypothetical protein
VKKFQIVFLSHSRVPTRQALQEAITGLRFRLSIDESYVPFECAGYIPCTLDGEDAGFEIKFSHSSARLGDMPVLRSQIGDRNTAITLRWGGDPRERASAMIVSAVLAESFDALVHCENDRTFHTPDQLLSEARAAFAQLQE